MGQIELHKQTGEMVYSTLEDKTLLENRLENNVNNTAAQLELEKASSQAKDNRIRTLEDIIIELGHDPKDPKAIQTLLKIRDADLAALRKKIKIPATIHPQTEEVAQQRQDQDVATLLVALHKQLVQTEGKLEETEAALQAALQQKEGGQTSYPPPEIINLEEPPQTTTPPTEQAMSSTSAPAPTSEQASSLDMQKLMSEIKVLEAQMTELNGAKENLAKLNEKYDKSKQNVVEKGREIKALKENIKELEKELTLDKVVA